MNFTKTIMTTASAALISSAAFAGSHMSMEMTIVSWGGAYSASQLKAYHEPYSAKTGVTILNDDSSSTAVAQLRAMNEANNITWDVVDVEAAPAMQLCDEGLALEIDPDTMLAPAPDGTPASEDFGDMLVSECFIPQIVYSTTFGYRTDLVGDTPPDNVCAVFWLLPSFETSVTFGAWPSSVTILLSFTTDSSIVVVVARFFESILTLSAMFTLDCSRSYFCR